MFPIPRLLMDQMDRWRPKQHILLLILFGKWFVINGSKVICHRSLHCIRFLPNWFNDLTWRVLPLAIARLIMFRRETTSFFLNWQPGYFSVFQNKHLLLAIIDTSLNCAFFFSLNPLDDGKSRRQNIKRHNPHTCIYISLMQCNVSPLNILYAH